MGQRNEVLIKEFDALRKISEERLRVRVVCSRSGLGRRRRLGRVWLSGNIWWVQYNFRRRVFRESSGSSDRRDAVKLLRRRFDASRRHEGTRDHQDA